MKYLIAISLLAVLGCSSSSDPEPPTPKPSGIRDGDNNLYYAVTIGSQTWLTTDLKTRHFLDGGSVGVFIGSVGGTFYKWSELNDTKGLCPSGFRIPSDAEFKQLMAFHGDDAEVLLDALVPQTSGYVDGSGNFQTSEGYYYYWISSVEFNEFEGYAYQIRAGEPIAKVNFTKDARLCVRCVRK